jgi:hypothetical protein
MVIATEDVKNLYKDFFNVQTEFLNSSIDLKFLSSENQDFSRTKRFFLMLLMILNFFVDRCFQILKNCANGKYSHLKTRSKYIKVYQMFYSLKFRKTRTLKNQINFFALKFSSPVKCKQFAMNYTTLLVKFK